MTHSLFAKALMGLEYALFRRGPLTMAPSQMGAFAFSDPSEETPNLEFHIQPLSLDKFGEPLHRFPAFTASAVPSCFLWITAIALSLKKFRTLPDL